MNLFRLGLNEYRGYEVVISVVDTKEQGLLSYTITGPEDNFIDSRSYPPHETAETELEITTMIEFAINDNANTTH